MSGVTGRAGRVGGGAGRRGTGRTPSRAARFPRLAALTAALALAGASAAPVEAQEAADVLTGLRSGGGWVAVPIEGGVGSASTATLPALGMTLIGCANVWEGHTGEFEIQAHETVMDTTLVFNAQPGVGIPFSHTFGMQAQIDVSFRWSEPRDTTLLMWVGLAVGRSQEEACQPVYGG